HGKRAIIKLDGINSREDANELRNQYLLVTRDEAVSLEEGEMFFFELIGLEVKTVEGQVLGSITDIIQTGANDVFVVQTSSKELLIPDIPEVVLEIDRQSRVVTVQLLPGLIDDK
ncbi:MAG: ribosome maturation factor RimM, partial [Chloroflexota bacterium]